MKESALEYIIAHGLSHKVDEDGLIRQAFMELVGRVAKLEKSKTTWGYVGVTPKSKDIKKTT